MPKVYGMKMSDEEIERAWGLMKDANLIKAKWGVNDLLRSYAAPLRH